MEDSQLGQCQEDQFLINLVRVNKRLFSVSNAAKPHCSNSQKSINLLFLPRKSTAWIVRLAVISWKEIILLCSNILPNISPVLSKRSIKYLSIVIPFDPPQTAWVCLVATLDDHLKAFFIYHCHHYDGSYTALWVKPLRKL